MVGNGLHHMNADNINPLVPYARKIGRMALLEVGSLLLCLNDNVTPGQLVAY